MRVGLAVQKGIVSVSLFQLSTDGNKINQWIFEIERPRLTASINATSGIAWTILWTMIKIIVYVVHGGYST